MRSIITTAATQRQREAVVVFRLGLSNIQKMSTAADHCAVLISGGLDSAILLGEALQKGKRVSPLYIRTELRWEQVELAFLQRYLQALACPLLQPLHILHLPVGDLYREHWSLTGDGVPDASTPDEAVFLPGRNVLLLAKALLWCHLNKVPSLALGVLGSNPFPDATDAFFEGYAAIVNQAVRGKVNVERPYAHLKKTQVMHRGRNLPLQWTFSCIQPIEGQHCGRCNKCAERRQAFQQAEMPDPTFYVGDP